MQSPGQTRIPSELECRVANLKTRVDDKSMHASKVQAELTAASGDVSSRDQSIARLRATETALNKLVKTQSTKIDRLETAQTKLKSQRAVIKEQAARRASEIVGASISLPPGPGRLHASVTSAATLSPYPGSKGCD
jgi:chromosome segregation ATPase